MGELIKLKDARMNSGLRSNFVAKLLKIAPNTLSQKEAGLRRFNMDEIAFLSDLYKIKLKQIYEYQMMLKDN